LLPTLDIGSHINAGPQARLVAGATQERTLAAVACRPMLGQAPAPRDLGKWCLILLLLVTGKSMMWVSLTNVMALTGRKFVRPRVQLLLHKYFFLQKHLL
jgi:hypothetical protein